MYNFGELQFNVATLVQRSGDASYIAKIPVWLNMGQTHAANMYDFWSELQAPPWSLATVSGQERYYLPSDFDKPFRIFDLTNKKKLTMETREVYFDGNVSSISSKTTGIPQYASLYGINAIATLPNGAFTIKAKSSSTSDTGGFVVRLEGWVDAAMTILGYTNITISSSSPTTYVSDPNAVSFYGITRCTKSGDTMGFFTIADNNGNILATIAPDDRQSRYPVMYLGLIPNGAFNYQLLYKRKIKKMVDNNDYPFGDIDDYLTTYAVGFAYNEEKETQPRAQQMFELAEKLLMEAIRNEQDKLGVNFQHKFVTSTAQSHRA